MAKPKNLHKIEWPREKLLHYGASKLSKSELFAILLRKGIKGIDVVELSKKILRKFPEFSLADANIEELKKTFGLGGTKACEIVACFELGRRMSKEKKNNLIFPSKDVWGNLKDIRNNRQEHFIVFYLDFRTQELKSDTISVGTFDVKLVHPKELFQTAILHSATQIIVVHNHLSGEAKPSADDLALNKRLKEAGKIMGIEMIDYIIVTKDSYFSLREKNIF